ncbi:16S rRNA (adenine(1518)-N(6)/adenine(1519)-N(6))-dimethyltransferase RsmA [Desulfofustis limnaeus]|uniref:Ribosomal RNA small subunit methyltransferase A n=1 Tax=Desulfofustis limnaeus TaxID=2740163 RepID=A0ABM7W8F7_9BACT|nr:16S rRNA (adenine(1518)-N(6)/adenine(1519)-N(6))-dimethyltransferase RsmA [Desulfofustis limnaeus]MDX9895597.1 16S rRNA (adenine(1518)-N(6)/adenine(1519)-N(6))-dimethyltransferase RsmA [Desulfofustis sp.]BDD87175.1 ribosomal RNA small subunit methyltransferase A [Desulfofustis limnaeus]
MNRPKSVKSTLLEHHLAPSKRLGQNFLIHRATAESIVSAAGFSPADLVVEVGVGLGALTIPLAAMVNQVIGIELDQGLIRYHEQERILPTNVSLVHGDVLRIDLTHLADQAGQRLKIIANLPYSISNPFIFRIIEYRQVIDQVVVMLQKEVADRLSAAPNTKSYGIPTVLLGSCARIERLLILSPDHFHPRPKIDSQVIRITFLHDDPQPVPFDRLQQLVRAAFASRRKTLVNNLLASTLGLGEKKNSRASLPEQRRQHILHALATLGLSPSIRGETLTVEQFQALTAALWPS